MPVVAALLAECFFDSLDVILNLAQVSGTHDGWPQARGAACVLGTYAVHHGYVVCVCTAAVVSCLPHEWVLDLPESRKLLGIAKCPDCVTKPATLSRKGPAHQTIHDDDGNLRRDIDHERLRDTACHAMSASTKKAAGIILDRANMDAAHLCDNCPFLGDVAHLTPACFPSDRLHVQCVTRLAYVASRNSRLDVHCG